MHVSTCLKGASTFALLLIAFNGYLAVPSHAQAACDPMTQFFGGCNNALPSRQSLGYATEPSDGSYGSRRVYVYRPHREAARTAFCVRTCDGRYFPVAVR